MQKPLHASYARKIVIEMARYKVISHTGTTHELPPELFEKVCIALCVLKEDVLRIMYEQEQSQSLPAGPEACGNTQPTLDDDGMSKADRDLERLRQAVEMLQEKSVKLTVQSVVEELGKPGIDRAKIAAYVKEAKA
jgi:hypothetical protein